MSEYGVEGPLEQETDIIKAKTLAAAFPVGRAPVRVWIWI